MPLAISGQLNLTINIDGNAVPLSRAPGLKVFINQNCKLAVPSIKLSLPDFTNSFAKTLPINDGSHISIFMNDDNNPGYNTNSSFLAFGTPRRDPAATIMTYAIPGLYNAPTYLRQNPSQAITGTSSAALSQIAAQCNLNLSTTLSTNDSMKWLPGRFTFAAWVEKIVSHSYVSAQAALTHGVDELGNLMHINVNDHFVNAPIKANIIYGGPKSTSSTSTSSSIPTYYALEYKGINNSGLQNNTYGYGFRCAEIDINGSALGKQVAAVANTAINAINGVVSTAINTAVAAMSAINNAAAAVTGAVNNAVNSVQAAVGSAVMSASSALSTTVSATAGITSGQIGSAITGHIGSVTSSVSASVSAQLSIAGANLGAGVGAISSAINGAITSISASIQASVNNALSSISSLTQNFIGNIAANVNAFSQIQVMTLNGCSLDINSSILNAIGGSAKILVPHINCGNTHDNFLAAFHLNARGLAAYSQNVWVTIPNTTGLKLHDMVTFQVNSSFISDPSSNGVYCITNMTRACIDNKYYDKLELTNSGGQNGNPALVT